MLFVFTYEKSSNRLYIRFAFVLAPSVTYLPFLTYPALFLYCPKDNENKCKRFIWEEFPSRFVLMIAQCIGFFQSTSVTIVKRAKIGMKKKKR